VSDPSLARRYASALFAAAKKLGQVEQVDRDLAAVVELLEVNRDLRGFLTSPHVLPAHKDEMIKTALGSRVQTVMVHFLQLLLDKKRFNLLDDVARSFRHMADEHRGVVVANVAAPSPLTEAQLQRLKERLMKMTGKTVELKCSIETEMLGGIKVVLGDRLLDGSVRNALSDLRDELRAVSVI